MSKTITRAMLELLSSEVIQTLCKKLDVTNVSVQTTSEITYTRLTNSKMAYHLIIESSNVIAVYYNGLISLYDINNSIYRNYRVFPNEVKLDIEAPTFVDVLCNKFYESIKPLIKGI